MDLPSQNSVSHWLLSLRRGSTEAAEKIWNRYFTQLRLLADRQLTAQQKRFADGEDIALNVLDTLIRGAENGRFPDLKDRRDLWCLLLAITKQKTVDLKRHQGCQKRGGGKVRGDSVLCADTGKFLTLDDLCGHEPTPEYLTALTEEHKSLMNLLRDDVLRRIASELMEGFSTREIAGHLNISIRAVQRKINVIRIAWGRALEATE
jgi:DNA-directed RNA polymerase specialized sigma24 family protein